MRWLLAPYAEPHTYRIFLYLLLGLPLGILDFALVITGLSLGLGLLVTLLGIPVLIATLVVVRGLAVVERRLAWSLLDAPMPNVPLAHTEDSGLWWARLRGLISSGRTWVDMGFVLLRLPLGILGFVIVMGILGLMLLGPVASILGAMGVVSEIGSWTIDSFGESLVFLPVSLVFVLVGPRLVVGWGDVSGRIATSMLGHVEPGELQRAVGDILARTGRADAFVILDELEMRLGRGPFLTPLRVEAALLSLESRGVLTAQREGPRTVYALT